MRWIGLVACVALALVASAPAVAADDAARIAELEARVAELEALLFPETAYAAEGEGDYISEEPFFLERGRYRAETACEMPEGGYSRWELNVYEAQELFEITVGSGDANQAEAVDTFLVHGHENPLTLIVDCDGAWSIELTPLPGGLT